MPDTAREHQSKLNHLASMPGLAHCTMRREELAQTLEETGGQMMARGYLWEIASKHLGAGVYRVQLKSRRGDDDG